MYIAHVVIILLYDSDDVFCVRVLVTHLQSLFIMKRICISTCEMSICFQAKDLDRVP